MMMTRESNWAVPELRARVHTVAAVALALALGACSRHPEVLAVVNGEIGALAADDTYVYASTTEVGASSLVRVPRQGGQVETIVPKIGPTHGLAVEGSKLYTAEISMQEQQGSGFTSVSADDVKRSGGIAQAVAADAHVYCRIGVISATGGSVTELARINAVPGQLMLDSTAIYMVSVGVWPSSGTDIDTTHGSLIKLPKTGGPVTVLADQLNKPRDLRFDDTSAYWASNGITWKIAKAGGAVPQRATTSPAVIYTDDPFDHSLVIGNTRYRAVYKDSRTTITAEPYPQ